MLVARGGRRKTHRNVGAYLLKPEVVGIGGGLEIRHVLRVAGVRLALDACALVGVVAHLGDVEGLIDVSALGLLLGQALGQAVKPLDSQRKLIQRERQLSLFTSCREEHPQRCV